MTTIAPGKTAGRTRRSSTVFVPSRIRAAKRGRTETSSDLAESIAVAFRIDPTERVFGYHSRRLGGVKATVSSRRENIVELKARERTLEEFGVAEANRHDVAAFIRRATHLRLRVDAKPRVAVVKPLCGTDRDLVDDRNGSHSAVRM